MFDICGKDIIVFNLSYEISKCIKDVLYILKLAIYLLSINELIQQGSKVEFEATKCWLKSYGSNKVILSYFKKKII
jgi:hypothetical protein